MKAGVGVIGCGNISRVYLENLKKFPGLELVAVSDQIRERAEEKAEEYNIPHVYSTEELLAEPRIQIVVNLTIPESHAEISMAALQAGKSVYVEKPLATTCEDGRKVLELADDNSRIAAAPDTFLGGGLQTCRKLIDDGWIGRPIAATAFMMCHGHESWHPNPEFYYKPGGGPMFDMGPYYLTALLTLLGSVKKVSGSASISFAERTITSQPKYGQKIQVEVPTHVVGILEFQNGAVGNIITSFDVWAAELPYIEIYGTEGTLSVPDPNIFGGSVRILRAGDCWREVPLVNNYVENSRGLGVADLAYALHNKKPHRASGALAYHVLEIMHGIYISAEEGKTYELESTCERPKPLPVGVGNDIFD